MQVQSEQHAFSMQQPSAFTWTVTPSHPRLDEERQIVIVSKSLWHLGKHLNSGSTFFERHG